MPIINIMLVIHLILLISCFNSTPNVVIIFLDDIYYHQNWTESNPDTTGTDYTYSVDTPAFDKIRNEGMVFPNSYCTAPSCAPARFSILTGRYPSKSEYSQSLAISRGTDDISNGTLVSFVTVPRSKIDTRFNKSENDLIDNLPYVLKSNGYYTGQVGKYHLSTATESEFALASIRYEKQQGFVQGAGFDYSDGLYIGNIPNEGNNCTIYDDDYSTTCPSQNNTLCECQEYSHNPEWLVNKAIEFMNESIYTQSKPFFLYFASTLIHSNGPVWEAMFTFPYTDNSDGTITSITPIGSQTFTNYMSTRTSMLDTLKNTYNDQSINENSITMDQLNDLGMIWLDDSIQSIINYLETEGVLDNTIFVIMNDHGQAGKTTLYQNGVRIFNFIRYPSLYSDGDTSIVSSFNDIIISQVDIAPTIYDIIGINSGWTSDGVTFKSYVTSNTANSNDEIKYVEFKKLRGVINGTNGIKYIWDFENNEEYLYDTLNSNENTNLVTSSSYSDELSTLRQLLATHMYNSKPSDDAASANTYPPNTVVGSSSGAALNLNKQKNDNNFKNIDFKLISIIFGCASAFSLFILLIILIYYIYRNYNLKKSINEFEYSKVNVIINSDYNSSMTDSDAYN